MYWGMYYCESSIWYSKLLHDHQKIEKTHTGILMIEIKDIIFYFYYLLFN